MSVLLPIGEFSRMTSLTVKALRHYHDVGLLDPADIDPASGYRLYSTAQVPTALLISRFRALEMPLEQVRAMLAASELATRNEIIVAHLQRMQERLDRTQATVASLRSLLEVRAPLDIEYRVLPAVATMAICEHIEMSDCQDWLAAAYTDIEAVLEDRGLAVAGAAGAIYSDEFFADSSGDVTAFVPIDASVEPVGAEVFSTVRVRALTLPTGTFAIGMHLGPFDEFDQTYAELGTIVAERGLRAVGPIREVYLLTDRDQPDRQRTEVCWPITMLPEPGNDTDATDAMATNGTDRNRSHPQHNTGESS